MYSQEHYKIKQDEYMIRIKQLFINLNIPNDYDSIQIALAKKKGKFMKKEEKTKEKDCFMN